MDKAADSKTFKGLLKIFWTTLKRREILRARSDEPFMVTVFKALLKLAQDFKISVSIMFLTNSFSNGRGVGVVSAGPHHGVADVPARADGAADTDQSVHP